MLDYIEKIAKKNILRIIVIVFFLTVGFFHGTLKIDALYMMSGNRNVSTQNIEFWLLDENFELVNYYHDDQFQINLSENVGHGQHFIYADGYYYTVIGNTGANLLFYKFDNQGNFVDRGLYTGSNDRIAGLQYYDGYLYTLVSHNHFNNSNLRLYRVDVDFQLSSLQSFVHKSNGANTPRLYANDILIVNDALHMVYYESNGINGKLRGHRYFKLCFNQQDWVYYDKELMHFPTSEGFGNGGSYLVYDRFDDNEPYSVKVFHDAHSYYYDSNIGFFASDRVFHGLGGLYNDRLRRFIRFDNNEIFAKVDLNHYNDRRFVNLDYQDAINNDPSIYYLDDYIKSFFRHDGQVRATNHFSQLFYRYAENEENGMFYWKNNNENFIRMVDDNEYYSATTFDLSILPNYTNQQTTLYSSRQFYQNFPFEYHLEDIYLPEDKDIMLMYIEDHSPIFEFDFRITYFYNTIEIHNLIAQDDISTWASLYMLSFSDPFEWSNPFNIDQIHIDESYINWRTSLDRIFYHANFNYSKIYNQHYFPPPITYLDNKINTKNYNLWLNYGSSINLIYGDSDTIYPHYKIPSYWTIKFYSYDDTEIEIRGQVIDFTEIEGIGDLSDYIENTEYFQVQDFSTMSLEDKVAETEEVLNVYNDFESFFVWFFQFFTYLFNALPQALIAVMLFGFTMIVLRGLIT